MDEPEGGAPAPTIDIMLVSHTNVGKTTLLRTLLGQDVGEVEDAPDVTGKMAAHDLVEAPGIGTLRLWDTPGFADSFRLARRLGLKHPWLAWIVREIWDRLRNPRLWRSQRLARDLRQRADAILYLVNALERPVDAVYVAPELEVLAWVGKPVIVIINQSGPAPDGPGESAAVAQWRQALAGQAVIRATLPLDSYSRHWLQELVLYDEIGQVLPDESRAVYRQLAGLLEAGHRRRFETSIAAMADCLLQVAGDRVVLDAGRLSSVKDAWDLVRRRIPWSRPGEMQPQEAAMASLAERYMAATRALTDELLSINRLSGVSAAEMVEAAVEKFSVQAPVDESATTMAGGVISGALAGLGADLMAGGLTLGTGALAGAVLGALGSAALARGYNVHTSRDRKIIAWSPDSMTEAFAKCIVLYLAISHSGRGRGEWLRRQEPEAWSRLAWNEIEGRRESLNDLWRRASGEEDPARLREACVSLLGSVLTEILRHLYPDAGDRLEPAART